MPPQGAGNPDLVDGLKAVIKPANRVQLKQPLTLLDVALTSWHVLGVPGTYKYHLQPLRFENLKRGTQSPSVHCRATLRTAHTFFHFSANQWAYLTEIGRKTSEKDAPVRGPDPD